MTETHDEIERRMQPGAWDTAGFLLPGESLRDCLAADAQTCARLGIEPGALGARLLDLLAAGRDSDLGRPVDVAGRHVTIMRQRGMITCPWALEEHETCPAGPGGHPNANRFQITVSGVGLDGFELSAHLIAAHSFFGGVGTRYRIEPQDALTATDPAR
ncbi:MAG: hypothetical protein ABI047_04295 [Jatrophihabitantaceae bacterium]